MNLTAGQSISERQGRADAARLSLTKIDSAMTPGMGGVPNRTNHELQLPAELAFGIR